MPVREDGMNLSKIKTGVYVCHCGTNIAATVDVAAVAEFARGLEGVVIGPRLYLHVLRPGPGPDQAGHHRISA